MDILKTHEREDGSYLSVFDLNKVPFEVKRIFFVSSGDNENCIRGKHAHYKCNQVLVCISGRIDINYEDNTHKGTVTLHPGDTFLHKNLEWAELNFIDKQSTMLSLCSEEYNEEDYIRDYNIFLKQLTNDITPIKHTIDLAGTHPLSIPNDIAIVGSSGRLSRTPRGPQIDAHDYVVRFNRAPIASYEELVGAKESLRVLNNHVFNNNKLDAKVWSNQPPNFVKDLRNKTLLYFASDLGVWENYKDNTHESCELYRVNYGELRKVKKALKLDLDGMFSVGVGFVCLCVVSGIVPTLYGFDTEPDSSRDHYWETRPAAGPCHNHSKEKAVLKLLEAQNKVIIK